MPNSDTTLSQLELDLINAIGAAETVATIEEIRVSALGKTGVISGLLKGMGAMSPDERRENGPVINGLRDRVSAAIADRKALLEAAELDAKLLAERVDLTLSARPRRKGGRRLPWKGLLIVVVTAGVLLGGAAWWKHARQVGEPMASAPDGAVADAGPVQVEELPADDLPVIAPADPADAASDAAMLADPELGLARDADLYAWFAAGGPVPVDESQPQPSRPEPATAGLETSTDE